VSIFFFPQRAFPKRNSSSGGDYSTIGIEPGTIHFWKRRCGGGYGGIRVEAILSRRPACRLQLSGTVANAGAVIARLLLEATEKRERGYAEDRDSERGRREVAEAALKLRKRPPCFSDAQIWQAWEEGRP
jgi:hypothetical protein